MLLPHAAASLSLVRTLLTFYDLTSANIKHYIAEWNDETCHWIYCTVVYGHPFRSHDCHNAHVCVCHVSCSCVHVLHAMCLMVGAGGVRLLL
jgi:hypothetical protein